MEKVTVHWKPKAISHLKKQTEWYAIKMGISAADKFWNAMIASGELLSTNPYSMILHDVTVHWCNTKIIRSSIL